MRGEVIQLDRRFPLVRLDDGRELRCEESAAIKKSGAERCVIGDIVEVSAPEEHEFMVVEQILPRETALVRRDPSDRSASQILASNFTQVAIIEQLDRFNIKRLIRELVLAHETRADVAVVLTKSDKVDLRQAERVVSLVREVAAENVKVHISSINDPSSISGLIQDVFDGQTTILLGQSGAGKSSLINALTGTESQTIGDVRHSDGKGRHTTVSRRIVNVDFEGAPSDSDKARPHDKGACRIVDMPGVRGLGLWDAEVGLQRAFADIEDLVQGCKFRDCRHGDEPGCAVRDAVSKGELHEARLRTYLELRDEAEAILKRRQQATWKNK